MSNTSTTVAGLRSELARILRLVEGGQEVVVTRHGHVIARLSPVRDKREVLSALGVRLAGQPAPLPRVHPSSRGLRRSLSRAVLEDRA